MTISSQTRKAGPFTGNDVTAAFPFAFKVFAAADLLVVKLDSTTEVETTLVLNTDYTVSLNGDQNASPGGTITLSAGALATGFTLTATSNVTPLQATDLTNQGGFYPAVITNALDKLTILIQQLLDKAGRALTLPLSTPSGVSTTLPLPSSNKVIGWNSTGDSLVNLNAADLATTVIGATKTIDVFSGNGSTTAFTLSADPLIENNTDVYISGVYQQKSEYSIAGTVLTFTSAPPAGSNNIEVIQSQAQTYPVTSLTDGVVTTTKIADDAVTQAKIESTYEATLVKDSDIANMLETADIDVSVQAYDAQLSSLIRQNSQSAAYGLVLTDGGKHILHPSADTTARTFTIPANSSVAYPIGTALTFINQNGAGVVTIAITSDTMRLAGAGTTGSRTLAANGLATAIKITATEWIISGSGLT